MKNPLFRLMGVEAQATRKMLFERQSMHGSAFCRADYASANYFDRRVVLCFVGSASSYFCPFRGGGGSGSPLTTVLSVPEWPPRGPTIAYWPDRGAFSPGLYCLLMSFASLAVREVVEIVPGRFVRVGPQIFAVRALYDPDINRTSTGNIDVIAVSPAFDIVNRVAF